MARLDLRLDSCASIGPKKCQIIANRIWTAEKGFRQVQCFVYRDCVADRGLSIHLRRCLAVLGAVLEAVLHPAVQNCRIDQRCLPRDQAHSAALNVACKAYC